MEAIKVDDGKIVLRDDVAGTSRNYGGAMPSAAATGAEVVLTGFTTGEADDVAATDTVNEAIAKLQARIAALE